MTQINNNNDQILSDVNSEIKVRSYKIRLNKINYNKIIKE